MIALRLAMTFITHERANFTTVNYILRTAKINTHNTIFNLDFFYFETFEALEKFQMTQDFFYFKLFSNYFQ